MAEPIESLVEELHNQVPRILEAAGVPGVSIALIQDWRCAWSGGFGVTNTHKRAAMTGATVFEAYSLTKPLVACRALQLCQSGAIQLDVPLCRYLPAQPTHSNDSRIRDVTLRMALSHTSGLADDEADGSMGFAPGTGWSYSTVGYYLVDEVLRHVTGIPLAPDMHDSLLAPLSMSCSSFVWQDRFADRMAQGHLADGLPQSDRKILTADADSLLTTAPDYAAFTARLLAGDPAVGLNAASLAEMFSNSVPPGVGTAPDPPSWGMGWGLQETPLGNRVWHAGGGPGSPVQNLVVACMEQCCGAVLLTNGANGQHVCAELVRLTLGGVTPMC
jgi:CubicO group peptidase (beta-lactamase class C family)